MNKERQPEIGPKSVHASVSGTGDPIAKHRPLKPQEIIFHGEYCIWWDEPRKVGFIGPLRMECCPHCGGTVRKLRYCDLMERWKVLESNSPGAMQFVLWQRGRCYRTFQTALDDYYKITGINLLA